MKLLVIIIIISLRSAVFGQDNQFLANKRNIIPGTRASLLGGAYTALSDDASGIYFNPAGMIFGPKEDLAISANAYYEKKVTYEGALNGQNFNEKSTGFFPSFIGSNISFKNLSLGWALVTLESQTYNQNDRYENISQELGEANTFNITHQQSSDYNLAGGGASLRLSSSFSIGASIWAYRRKIEASNHQMVSFNNGSLLVLDFKIDTENIGAMAVLGFQWRTQNHSFGLSYRTYHSITDKSTLTRDLMNTEADGLNAQQTSTTGSSNFFNEINTDTTRMGYAFTAKRLIITSELIYYAAAEGASEQQDLQAGYDLGMGVEIPTPWIILRTSLFTNNSLYATPELGQVGQPHHIDFIGHSVGLSVKRGKSESSLGLIKQQGTGVAQKVAGSSNLQNVSSSSFAVIFGSSYEF